MKTDPALRITCTRSRAAIAVGTTPRNTIAKVVRGLAGVGTPSKISMAGIRMQVPTTSVPAARAMGSMGGHRRVMIDAMA